MRRALALAPALALAVAGCTAKSKKRPARDAAPPPADAAVVIDAGPVALPPAPPLPERHRGLPRVSWGDRQPTAERVELGRLLFSDASVFGTGAACANCHDPERAFSSAAPLPETAAGKTNLRNAPALHDLAYQRSFYRDGRADSITALIPGHVVGQLGADLAEIAVRLATDRRWRAQFARAFDAAPSPDNLAIALADYARTRFSPRSAWDRHEAGEPGAVSEAAIRGAAIFNERAGCAVCHPPPLYTDLSAHPTAVPAGAGPVDPGRGRVTDKPGDHRAFKTPSLRAVSATGPYFHAGTAVTLADAVAVELGRADAGLTPAERADLVAFLEAL